MKKRTISLLALALLMGVALGVGLWSAPTRSVYAQGQFEHAEITGQYVRGDRFTVPECYVTVGDTRVKANATLVYPDGTARIGGEVTLSQEGQYIIRYSQTVNGIPYAEEISFVVRMPFYSVSSDKSSVVYGLCDKFEASSKGLIVSLAQGDTLNFNYAIDVADLVKSSFLAQMFVIPTIRGTADFDKITVTLTDSANSENKLNFDIKRWLSNSAGFNKVYCSAYAPGQPSTGYDRTQAKYAVNTNGGSHADGSFIAQLNGSLENPTWSGVGVAIPCDLYKFAVSYNNEDKSVWFGNDSTRMSKVVTFDDRACFDTLWQGFASDKVFMSISASGYSNDTANFCLTQVLGLADISSASPWFNENVAPVISVHAKDADNMPYAYVNGYYPVPEATAYDTYDGECDVKTTVWYENDYMVTVRDGRFFAAEAGTYRLVYTASDRKGNMASETVYVTASTDIPKLQVTVTSGVEKIGTTGKQISLTAPVISGGSGDADFTACAYHSASGTFIDDLQKKDMKFIPEYPGIWTIGYTASDFAGGIAHNSYTITVTTSDNDIINSIPALPQMFVAGSKFELPEIYATDYTSGNKRTKPCKVEITDASGVKIYTAGDSFIPNVAENGDEVSIRYYSGDTTLDTVRIPAVKVLKNDFIILENYFAGDNVQVSIPNTAGAQIIAKQAGNAEFKFANAQWSEGFSLDVSSIAGRSDFSALVITLSDYTDATRSVSLRLEIGNARVTARTSGASLLMNDTFKTAAVAYAVKYERGNFYVGNTALAVTAWDDGSLFDGFADKRVFFSCKAENATANNGYRISSIAGHAISVYSSDSDYIAPNIHINGVNGGSYVLNTRYTVPSATTWDVLSPDAVITLTVQDGDGNAVTDINGVLLQDVPCDKEYTFLIDKVTMYNVVYAAKEEGWLAANERLNAFSVAVADREPPVVKWSAAWATHAKVGDVIYFPDYTVTDNMSPADEIEVVKFVYTPAGKLILLDGNYNALKVSIEGVYEFRLYIQDSAGNFTIECRQVTVTE